MASVSGKYTTGATGMGTSNSQAQSGLWSYAVPSDEAATESTPTDYNANDYDSTSHSREPLSNHVNDTSRPRTKRKDKSFRSPDTEYAMSGNQRTVSQSYEQGDPNRTENVTEGVHELYRPSKEQMRVSSKTRHNVKRKESLGAVSALDEPSGADVDSKWIHRDKLAQIEHRELQAMGVIPAHRLSSRSRSRQGKKSSKSPSMDFDPEAGDDQLAGQDLKRQRTETIEESNLLENEDPLNQDRAPSSDHSSPRSQVAQHGRRPSTSKIPVTKGVTSSPPQPTSPNQRVVRTTSASQASQNLLNATNSTPTSTFGTPGDGNLETVSSPQLSPSKAKIPSKANPPSATRGGTRGGRSASGQSRPRTATGNGNGTPSRPGTSGGNRSPEGEPPWIATMYKPDPRLPPDQQMLPTHAKRLAQERDMQQGTMMYETAQPESTDFMLLDSDEQENEESSEPSERDRNLQHREAQADGAPAQFYTPIEEKRPELVSQSDEHHIEQQRRHYNDPSSERWLSSYATQSQENGSWPLRTSSDKEVVQVQQQPESAKSDTQTFNQPTGRSGTPNIDSNYSLIPATVRNQKEGEQGLSQRSRLPNANSNANANAATSPIRVPEAPEPDEKEQKKKSCACCIVM